MSCYAPIILLKSCNSTSFMPAVLNTKPTAIKAITKKPISFENSLLNPRYIPITTIAISTSDCALLKNQLYKFCLLNGTFWSPPTALFRILQMKSSGGIAFPMRISVAVSSLSHIRSMTGY